MSKSDVAMLRIAAADMAIAAGYVELIDPAGPYWVAPLGRFEGEPWYLPYFYDAILNGDGEPFGDAERTELVLLDVSDDERAAFELEPDTVAVAITYSDVGFIGLVELSAARRDALVASFDVDDSDSDSEG